jgi:hypothetical protein
MIAKSEGAGDRVLMIKATMMGSKVSFFLMMALYVPVLIEMPYILSIWLINVPEFTVIFCQLLLIRNLIEQLFIPLSSAISAEGNISQYQVVSSVISFAPLPISYILFDIGYPVYTLYSVFLFFSILTSLIVLYFSNKNYQLPVSEFLINIAGRCVVAFLMVFSFSLIPYLLMTPGFSQLVWVMSMSIFSYLIIVFFIGFTNDERIMIRKFITPILMNIKLKFQSR